MGLDDFTSGDTTNSGDDNESNKDENENKSSDTNSTDEVDKEIASEMDFYGSANYDPGTTPMEREGVMSEQSTQDLLDQKDGDIEIESDHIKYYTPVFYIIGEIEEYDQGNQYRLTYQDSGVKPAWHNRVVTCIGVTQTSLGKINKEVVMYDVGLHQKSDVMDAVASNLGDNISANTPLEISFFGEPMFMRDLAQASNKYKDNDVVNRDLVRNKVMRRNMLRLKLEEDE